MPARREAELGLRLALPGAPNTPHMVQGLPGWYWPEHTTPVGAPGEPSPDRARDAHADPGVPVILVEIDAKEAAERRKEIGELRGIAAPVIRTVARSAPAGEAAIARDELAAIAAEKED